MKKFLIIIGIAVVFLAGITIFKNFIIKSVATTVISRIAGAPVHIDSLSLNIFNSTLRINGFKIYNPLGFPKGILVSCPRVDVIYDQTTLFKEKKHLLVVNIELAEMGLVRNKEGRLNVDSLNVVASNTDPVPIQIDLVTLGIGKIVYKDYRNGTEPDVRVYDVNKHKSYKSIPTAQQLVLLVMAEPMRAAGIKSAQIYGVVMLAGVAVLPVAVVATFIGKNSVQQSVDVGFEKVYEVSLGVLKRMGKVVEEDPRKGKIQANVNGADVAVQLKRVGNRTEVMIFARKYMFPKLDIAGGVLYQISEKL
ncbi:MAG: hypothetical protein HQL16_00980 [Candidatus Omnitrophica bacterium]|nr:hypothetical protein [Candidatus Omnitrophota bacterium]